MRQCCAAAFYDEPSVISQLLSATLYLCPSRLVCRCCTAQKAIYACCCERTSTTTTAAEQQRPARALPSHYSACQRLSTSVEASQDLLRSARQPSWHPSCCRAWRTRRWLLRKPRVSFDAASSSPCWSWCDPACCAAAHCQPEPYPQPSELWQRQGGLYPHACACSCGLPTHQHAGLPPSSVMSVAAVGEAPAGTLLVIVS
jgi:hypothetical protein